MSSLPSIRETIARIGRVVRQSKVLENPENKAVVQKNTLDPQSSTTKSPKVVQSIYKDLRNDEVKKYKPLYQDFQRKVYREFLQPLDMPGLKTFNDKRIYDTVSAKQAWLRKSSKDPRIVLQEYIQDRRLFRIMVSTLLDLTPSSLKDIDYNNPTVLNKILLEQEQIVNEYKIQVPTHCFNELPPIPSPITRENFHKYIYKLTNTNYHYKNSSSLQSGIIPSILLYTHKLTTQEFKDYRSTQTYNCLISYFGFSKNQSTFARELLLVMKNDGHGCNIDTINLMLKILSIQSKIRGNTNTYGLILKYLQLSASLNIQVNLATYSYIYSTINNIHLKEDFLKMMHDNGVPIPKSMMLKILDDFAKTTTDYHDIINFIETDLGYKTWANDSTFSKKVVYSQALNAESYSIELEKFNIDEYTLVYLIQGIRDNKVFKDKAFSMIRLFLDFVKRSTHVDFTNVPRIFQLIARQLMNDLSDVRKIETLVYLLRCVIYEATQKLRLPIEIIDYGDGKTTSSENYKIMSRIIGRSLQEVDAKIIYINRNLQDACIKSTSVLLDDKEIEIWNQLKTEMEEAEPNTLENLHLFKMIKSGQVLTGNIVDVPQEAIQKILSRINSRISIHRNRERVVKISEGADENTKRQMIERGLMKESSSK